jgi:hypothetical protein
MKKTCLTIICILYGFLKLCAIENHTSGARARSLSNAFVSVSDIWSTFHNQAGLAHSNKISTGFYYESRFLIEELSFTAGTLNLPVRSGTFGLSFCQFGKGSFKENKIGLAYAKTLSEKLSAGVQLDYLSQRFPENQRSKGFATFEAGVIYAASPNLFLGIHLFNPISAGIETPEGKQNMPAIYRIGGHYQFKDMVLLSFETQNETGTPILIKTGIEFSPVENLFLRFGLSGKPLKYTTGIGYKVGKISTDIAFSYHGNLGITPSVSLQIEL